MKDYIYLIAPVIAWPICQSIKFAINLRKDGLQWRDLVQSGGMPSSHSAMMLSILTVVGLGQGVKSIAFAIVFTFSAIVIYDSLGVRRTTGEQTAAITEMAANAKKPLNTVIHDARGHNYSEVLAGCLVGLLIGLLLHVVIK